jgi:hypothetical protein
MKDVHTILLARLVCYTRQTEHRSRRMRLLFTSHPPVVATIRTIRKVFYIRPQAYFASS